MKTTMKFVVTLAIILLATVTFSQVVDTTQIAPLPTSGGIEWLWWALGFLVAVVYPIFARLIPTSKNWDWLTWVIRLIGLIIPNKKKGGGEH